MSFLRHGEIYRWDEKQGNEEPVSSSSPPHPIDESPVGYSFHPSDEDLSLGARPWRVGLHQSPPPLRQLWIILEESRLFEK
jgi:hypothetical protein